MSRWVQRKDKTGKAGRGQYKYGGRGEVQHLETGAKVIEELEREVGAQECRHRYSRSGESQQVEKNTARL